MIYCSSRMIQSLTLGVSLFCIMPAHASLGGDSTSVQSDATELHGVVKSAARELYDIQDISAENEMHVREFLNREGVVFALSWSGPVLPSLQGLLGPHFIEYTTALAGMSHPGLQRSVQVALPGLVVESGGHMRAYSGRAYLPNLIPAGVLLAELR